MTTNPASPSPQQFLARHLGGAPGDWQLRAIGRRRLNSAVYCAEDRSRRTKVLLKRTAPPSGNPILDAHGAAAQCQALTEAAVALGATRDCRVPAVLACAPEAGLLALEWLNAPSATAAIATARDEITAAIFAERCGRWLASYHDPREAITFDPLNRIEHLNEAIGAVPASPRLRALVDLLQSTAEGASIAVPLGWVHSDFKTDNLLIGPESVWGIDMAPRKRHFVLPDMAMHLNHAALIGMDQRWPGLERSFMSGYADVAGPVAQRALDWLRVQMLTERLLEARHAPVAARLWGWRHQRRTLSLAEALAWRLR